MPAVFPCLGTTVVHHHTGGVPEMQIAVLEQTSETEGFSEMIAAIYARKSTEQTGVADEQRSVSRQIENARGYAARKGWTIAETHVYVDDGISGAEFAARPGFLRLMNSLKPRPAFDVLIVSEESRIGRESIEVSFALKQLVQAGVRVFCYLTDSERTLNSPIEKAMLALQTMADEMEREKARMRVTDAMVRKAKAGHVCGNSCFGYRNVDVTAPGPDGRLHRQYVRREIIDDEAAAIRRIFDLCAAGDGLKAITKTLNAEGALSPRSQRGRPRSWSPSTVREVLHRETYRGVVVYNRTKKRDAWGQKRQVDRPEAEWLRTEAEHLRIVSDALWTAAHARLTARAENYRVYGWKSPDGRGVRSQYLLSGHARCDVCGGSMQAVSRQSTTGRLFRYTCSAHWNRGGSVCGNGRMIHMETADHAVRELIASEVLKPAVIERALCRAVELLRGGSEARDREQQRKALTKRLAALDVELSNLAEAAAHGGAVPVILERLALADRDRRTVARELQQIEAETPAAAELNVAALKRTLRGYLDEWHAMIRGNVAEARAVFETVLRDRVRFRPVDGADGAPSYELTVPVGIEKILSKIVPSVQVRVASPNGSDEQLTDPKTIVRAA